MKTIGARDEIENVTVGALCGASDTLAAAPRVIYNVDNLLFSNEQIGLEW